MENINKEWIEEYINLLIDENYEKQIELLLSKIPPKLYRYRPLNKFTIDSLEKNYIYMCDLDKLNDPYECYPKYDEYKMLKGFIRSKRFIKDFKIVFGKELTFKEHNVIVNSDDMINAMYEACKKKKTIGDMPQHIFMAELLLSTKRRAEEDIAEARKDIKTCSFSTNNESTIMWSHYSTHHKGICVEYKFKNSNTLEKHGILSQLYPVYYSNIFPEFHSVFDVSSYMKTLIYHRYKKELIGNMNKNGE